MKTVVMKLLFHTAFAFGVMAISSCSVMEKSSSHGFESGFYSVKSGDRPPMSVYLHIDEDQIDGYTLADSRPIFRIELSDPAPSGATDWKFQKKSMDIDITSNVFKFRPGLYRQPAQMTTDFNAALYAGWRHDTHIVTYRKNPLDQYRSEIKNRGYDIGIFAGPGIATIDAFSTRNLAAYDYSALTLQYGIAGFLESSFASFGLSAGFDHLFSPDRKVWIYQNQPWIGFIVGIAIN